MIVDENGSEWEMFGGGRKTGLNRVALESACH